MSTTKVELIQVKVHELRNVDPYFGQIRSDSVKLTELGAGSGLVYGRTHVRLHAGCQYCSQAVVIVLLYEVLVEIVTCFVLHDKYIRT